MALKALLCGLLVLGSTFVTALDFSKSKWIWKNHDYAVPPHELGAFRYDFIPRRGKTAAAAEILIAGDNNYTLWVNGECLGVGNNWEQSQAYCVTLKPGRNLFAVEIENQPPTSPAALISAIQIIYTDRTTHTIVTDGTWRANNAIAGFQLPGYDDSAWPHAIVQGSANRLPWHTPANPIPPSSLSFTDSFWIWTKEVASPGGNAPIGHRAFRSKIRLPGGVSTKGGTIIFDVDNGYTLYINGKKIGAGNDWPQAQRWNFTLDHPTDVIVIAADAYNAGGPAGIISAVDFEVKNHYCSACSIHVSDCTWKYSYTVPAGFEQIDYDDSDWLEAFAQGLYGMLPWEKVPIETGN